MTEQQLYRIAIRGHDREQNKRGDFYLTEGGVTAELESVRNFKGDVVHLDIFKSELPDLPMVAVEWLRARDLPLTYIDFLRADPPAHKRAILVETRRWLHHQRIDRHMRVEKLRREHKPYIGVRPNPRTEGHIDAMERSLAWMDDEITELSKQITTD